MSLGILFIIIGIIMVGLLEVNHYFSGNKFINEVKPAFDFLLEDDYEFLVKVKYGDVTKEDINNLFSQRIRNAVIIFIVMLFIFITRLSYIYVIAALLIAFLVFKLPYINLKNYYKANLNKINLLLPYYLKSLEILCQHYTIPVALAKSVDTAPEIFKDGLKRLIAKIDAGDASVQPYMDFAHEYPVRDSMRMMRLLYRLSLGSQENKHEQLLTFSRTISALQNKAREQKYKERLEKMENKTMIMLFGTGGSILAFLMISMMMMMNI